MGGARQRTHAHVGQVQRRVGSVALASLLVLVPASGARTCLPMYICKDVKELQSMPADVYSLVVYNWNDCSLGGAMCCARGRGEDGGRAGVCVAWAQ